MNHEDFKKVLQSGELLRKNMSRMTSIKHQMSVVTKNKISLTSYDDKRFYLDDGITSLAYGHFRTVFQKVYESEDESDIDDDDNDDDDGVGDELVDSDAETTDGESGSFIDEDMDNFGVRQKWKVMTIFYFDVPVVVKPARQQIY